MSDLKGHFRALAQAGMGKVVANPQRRTDGEP